MSSLRRKNPGGPPPKSHQQILDRVEYLAEESMNSAQEILDQVAKLRRELTEARRGGK